jgi:hypothetical protein
MPRQAKKILFVTLIHAYWGGSEILWSQAAPELLARRHHVTAHFGHYRNQPEVCTLFAPADYLRALRWSYTSPTRLA